MTDTRKNLVKPIKPRFEQKVWKTDMPQKTCFKNNLSNSRLPTGSDDFKRNMSENFIERRSKFNLKDSQSGNLAKESCSVSRNIRTQLECSETLNLQNKVTSPKITRQRMPSISELSMLEIENDLQIKTLCKYPKEHSDNCSCCSDMIDPWIKTRSLDINDNLDLDKSIANKTRSLSKPKKPQSTMKLRNDNFFKMESSILSDSSFSNFNKFELNSNLSVESFSNGLFSDNTFPEIASKRNSKKEMSSKIDFKEMSSKIDFKKMESDFTKDSFFDDDDFFNLRSKKLVSKFNSSFSTMNFDVDKGAYNSENSSIMNSKTLDAKWKKKSLRVDFETDNIKSGKLFKDIKLETTFKADEKGTSLMDKICDKSVLADQIYHENHRSSSPIPIITYPSDDEEPVKSEASPVSVIVDCDTHLDDIQKFLESIEKPLNISSEENDCTISQNKTPIPIEIVPLEDIENDIKIQNKMIKSPNKLDTDKSFGFNTFPIRKHTSHNIMSNNTSYTTFPFAEEIKSKHHLLSELDYDSCDEMDKLKSVTTKLRLDSKRPSIMAWKEQTIEKPYLWRHRIAHEVVNKAVSNSVTEERVTNINEAIIWLTNELEQMRNKDQILARTFITLRHNISSYKLEKSVAHIIEDAVEQEKEKHDHLSDVSDIPPDQFCPRLKQVGVTPMQLNRRRFSVF